MRQCHGKTDIPSKSSPKLPPLLTRSRVQLTKVILTMATGFGVVSISFGEVLGAKSTTTSCFRSSLYQLINDWAWYQKALYLLEFPVILADCVPLRWWQQSSTHYKPQISCLFDLFWAYKSYGVSISWWPIQNTLSCNEPWCVKYDCDVCGTYTHP